MFSACGNRGTTDLELHGMREPGPRAWVPLLHGYARGSGEERSGLLGLHRLVLSGGGRVERATKGYKREVITRTSPNPIV